MTTHKHTKSEDILALVINRNPGMPATVAQALADHLQHQDDRIHWLQYEARTLRKYAPDDVNLFEQYDVCLQVDSPTVWQRFKGAITR